MIERFVDSLDSVVALLVIAIDRAFDLSDSTFADVGAAGDVFLVPEQVVELMLLADGGQQPFVAVVDLARVPAGDRVAMQIDDLFDQGRGGERHEGGPWEREFWGRVELGAADSTGAVLTAQDKDL